MSILANLKAAYDAEVKKIESTGQSVSGNIKNYVSSLEAAATKNRDLLIGIAVLVLAFGIAIGYGIWHK